MALKMRNFSPASLDLAVIKKADKAARGKVVSSREMYMVINSPAAASNIIPVAEKRIRA